MRRQSSASSTDQLGLLDFVARVSPHLQRPHWLAPIAEALERSQRERVRLVVSVPPQHGKSTLLLHALAHDLLRVRRPILYVTYSETFAISQMRDARIYAESAGLELASDQSRAICEWRATGGGRLYATGIGGSITGRPGGLIILDDLIKDWVEAQSRRIRDNVDAWLRAVVLTRAHPTSSVFLVMTRWHEDDQAARLIARGWDAINLEAITPDGKALWPEERPLSFLEEQRSPDGVGASVFDALYMGRPRRADGTVFGPPAIVDAIPRSPNHRRVIGADFAYSAKAQSDWSVAVVMATDGTTYWLEDVLRAQSRPEDFARALGAFAAQHGSPPIHAYLGGQEEAMVAFLRTHGIHVHARRAVTDKRVRATPLAARWNDGAVHIPRVARWAQATLGVFADFTGSGQDACDDDVDAAAAAYDALAAKRATSAAPGKTQRTTAGMGRYY